MPAAPRSAQAATGDSRERDVRKSGQRDAQPANQANLSTLKLNSAGGEAARRPAGKPDGVAESLATKKEAVDNEAGANLGATLDRTAKGKAMPSPGTSGDAARQYSSPAAGFGGGQGAGGYGGLAGGAAPAGDAAPGVANKFQIVPGGQAGGFGAPGSGAATLRGGQSGARSRASSAPLAEGGQLAGGESRSIRPSSSPAQTVLYANPQLVTDASGRVTIEFTMPPGETAYRLLVDALGKGRIGSKQEIIVGSEHK